MVYSAVHKAENCIRLHSEPGINVSTANNGTMYMCLLPTDLSRARLGARARARARASSWGWHCTGTHSVVAPKLF